MISTTPPVTSSMVVGIKGDPAAMLTRLPNAHAAMASVAARLNRRDRDPPTFSGLCRFNIGLWSLL
jgi:hypothetical protein